MYFRISKSTYKNKAYRHLKLVEHYWDSKAQRRRTKLIKNFGNLEILSRERIESLFKSLARCTDTKLFRPENLTSRSEKIYGEILVAQKIWNQLRLPEFLQDSLHAKKIQFNVALFTFVLVLNRLIKPKSERGIIHWHPRLFLPELREIKGEIGIHQFYRTLDFLNECNESLQMHLYNQLTDLFNLEVDIIFYDTTSSYFYTEDGDSIRQFGHSRDKRGDLRQIILGLVTTKEGFPIAHQIFPGNKSDCKTVPEIVQELEKKFKIRRIIFVGDSAMFSAANVKELEKDQYQHKYILGIRSKTSIGKELLDPDIKNYEIIERLDDSKPKLYVKDVAPEKGPRYLLCYNPEEAKRDAHFRENIIQKTLKRLEHMKKTIKSKRFRDQKQIQSAITETFKHGGARKFFTYSYSKEQGLRYELNQEAVKQDSRSDGIFVLQTSVRDMPAKEIVAAYKNLLQVENAFREIKNFIHIRPIFHQRERRISAHVLICVLAYLIERIIEHTLHKKGIKLSARRALDVLHSVKMVENDLAGTTVHCITSIDKECGDILDAFDIKIDKRTFVSK